MLRRGPGRRPSPRERGMVLVLVAVAMVVVLIMAAFVVDFGWALSDRRQAQTAADAAALAAARDLPLGTDGAARSAMGAVRNNLTTTYTDTQWAALWAGCSDASALEKFALTVNTRCVSFDGAYARVRVRIPNQVRATVFAGIAGVSSMTTTASATAQLKVIPGNGVLPFAIAGFSGDATNQICYTLGGCGGGSSDTLVAIDSPLTGNPQYGGIRDCPASGVVGPPGDLSRRFEYNTAQGTDHFFAVYTNPPGTRQDNCSVEIPNTMYTLAREFSNGLKVGLWTGPSVGSTYPDGKMARLARFPGDGCSSQLPNASAYSPPWEHRVVGPDTAGTACSKSAASYTLDNRPLWEFIPTNATNIPTNCTRSNFDGATGPGGAVSGGQAKMLTCLTNYANGNPARWAPLFTARSASNPDALYDIQLSSRVGYVPIVIGSTGWQPIQAFKMFFINTVYTNCAGGCDTPDAGGLFRTGEGTVTSPLITPLTTFQGISAIRIYDTALPIPVIDAGPQNYGRSIPLGLVQ